MHARRTPQGYLGLNHQVIGMSILAVLKVLKFRDASMELETQVHIGPIDPVGWYPIGTLLELMDRLEVHVGYFGLMRMGRMVFTLSHQATVAQRFRSVRAFLYGLDELYRHTNRGSDIGGWKVLRFQPGDAEIEKTTPHHCAMEQGILTAALASADCAAIVSQSRCVREGAATCRFVISSAVTDSRWG